MIQVRRCGIVSIVQCVPISKIAHKTYNILTYIYMYHMLYRYISVCYFSRHNAIVAPNAIRGRNLSR